MCRREAQRQQVVCHCDVLLGSIMPQLETCKGWAVTEEPNAPQSSSTPLQAYRRAWGGEHRHDCSTLLEKRAREDDDLAREHEIMAAAWLWTLLENAAGQRARLPIS